MGDYAPATDDATSRSLARRVGAWAIATALLLGGVSFACDALLVGVRGRSGVRMAFCAGLVAFALATVVGFALAPIAALVEAASLRIERGGGRLGALWPLPLAFGALMVAVVATDSFSRRQQGANVWVIVGFPIGVVAAAALARWRERRVATPLAVAFAMLAFAASVLEQSEERVRHDLLIVLVACGTLAAATPIRRRLRRASVKNLALLATLLVAWSTVTLVSADHVAAGWRARSEQWASFGPALARAGRAATDLDGDGYSPLFWSGDCDDFDSSRNPRAHETNDGIDHNCNGAVPPPHATDAQLGLPPAMGDPALGVNDVDLVLLVTIDCMRADALRPEIMPHVTALASQGVTMTRAYSVGASTLVSLGFVQRPNGVNDPTVAARLAELGIESTLVFSYGFGADHRADVFLNGFTKTELADATSRFDAATVTDRGLSALAASHGRTYLWLHYYDAHAPIEVVPTPSTPAVDGLPPAYVAGLGAIDVEIGRVVDALRSQGRFSRTAFIVTADHGEAFGAHGIPYHALSAYEVLVHVPVVLVAPGLAPRRFDGLVTHRDLPATILGAFGLSGEARAAERFGRSWLRLRGAPTAPLHDFVVSYGWMAKLGERHLSPLAAIIEPRRKLLEGFGNTLEELYDPLSDPGELDDLAPTERDTVARLHRTLAIYRDVDGFL
jgi:choline-sulfatase